MKFITISREYGAGGGEVAARLADLLGWDLLDHEWLHRAAQLEHLPDAELEAIDEQAVTGPSESLCALEDLLMLAQGNIKAVDPVGGA